jgi:hypothetical protein
VIRRVRSAGEEGFAAGGEALAFGVLVFVIGTLLVVNAWGVIDAKLAASAAAREAARVAVEAPGTMNAGEVGAAASATVQQVLVGLGKDAGRLVDVELGAEQTAPDAPLSRCQRVTVTVTYRVPTIVLPWVGGLGNGFRVVGSHSELVDPFRSGLPGEARCGR